MGTAIVTGATRGIGLATARRLGGDGCWVLATGRDASAGADLEQELQSLAGGEFLAADLVAPGTPERVIGRAVEATGTLDILVNNAGLNEQAGVGETTGELYDRVMDINLRAATLLAAASIGPMRANGGGVIINISSECGIVGFPGQAAYNISKAGLIMLSRSIVADHSRDGIRAVTVCPGTTATPLVEGLIDGAADPTQQKAALEDRPAGRLGRPEELAEVIAFAASTRAPYMTGTEIVVDGGKTSAV